METTPSRRRTALALLLSTLTLAAAGCDRRPSDPTLPSTGTTSPTPPSTTSPGTVPDSAASAASR